jgi:hypothetical protein
MKSTIKTVSIIAAVIFLQACAGPKLRLEQPGAGGSLGSITTISIEDKRPADDKEYSMGSAMVFSPSYSIQTMGDEKFEPHIVETFKIRLQRALAREKQQPQTVKVTLDRLVTQANAQAYNKRSASEGLSGLHVWIAEQMAGHKFDMNIDNTKPFVMSALKGNAEVVWPDKTVTKVPLNIVHALNYPTPMHHQELQNAAVTTANAVLDASVDAIVEAKR